MQERKEPVHWHYPGPLESRGLPDGVLYEARLRFLSGAVDPTAALGAALSRYGPVRVSRLPWLGTRMRLGGTRYPLVARLRGDRVEVAFQTRLKGKALTRFVEALEAIDGARDLEVDALTPHFDAPYSDIGPCSPCAAGRYPPTKR